jgi:lipase chaperone LimK
MEDELNVKRRIVSRANSALKYVKMLRNGSDIMMTLFDDEYILKTYVEEKEKEAADQAKMEEKKQTAISLADMGLPVEKIAQVVKVSANVVKQWLASSVTLPLV